MRYPAEIYTPSPRPYKGLPQLEYPFHDRTVTITRCGRICMGRQKINLSQAFAGQRVGGKQVAERVWLVSFMQYDLGYFDDETCRIESAENPFSAKLSPMSPYMDAPRCARAFGLLSNRKDCSRTSGLKVQ
jgi:putative transposase